MSKTTNILAVSSILNFGEIGRMLDYCKKHSSEETYSIVIKSYKKTIISTLILIFILLFIFIGGIIYFDKAKESKITTNNISYSSVKRGHIGNGVVWYIDNVKYEIDISDFGYNISDYEKETNFDIYLDENHNVVDVKPVIKGNLTSTDKFVWWIVGSLVSMCIILIAYINWIRYSKSRLNPSKEYFEYIKWFMNKSEDGEWYSGYND